MSKEKSKDPRIQYLDNAISAKEKDLRALGVKVGILGELRTDFDILLVRSGSEDDDQYGRNFRKKDEASTYFYNIILWY